MPVYRYKAARLNGKTVRGELQAVSKAVLHEQLQAQELYLTDCREVTDKQSGRKLNARALSEFCRELGMMLGAGVPLVRALSIMSRRDIKKNLKDVYVGLHRSLKQGVMLSEAMTRQANVFPDLLVSMIRSSEVSGSMDVTALRMADHYDKSYRLNKRVKSALTYPIILASVTAVVLLVVFLVVLPRFFKLFDSMNAELPVLTQFMIDLSQFLQNNYILLGVGVAALVIVLRLLMRVPSVRVAADHMKLRLPVVGKLLKVIYTARFARTLSSCYASGVSIISALANTKDTVGNAYIASQFADMIKGVRSGRSLSASIGGVDGFDSKLSASVEIGEETGRLFDMLNATADAFDYDADIALTRLTALIEPVMLVVMAVIIGAVIISVMMPMTTLYDAIGGASGAAGAGL